MKDVIKWEDMSWEAISMGTFATSIVVAITCLIFHSCSLDHELAMKKTELDIKLLEKGCPKCPTVKCERVEQ